MKSLKVLNLRTHVGGLYGKNSYDAVKDKAEMYLTPLGVYISALNGKPARLLVHYPNCVETQLESEADLVFLPQESAHEDGPTEPKRGPGRPPGPRAA